MKWKKNLKKLVHNSVCKIMCFITSILYLSCNEICKKNNVTQFNNNKKNYGNPMDTSSVCVVMHTCVTWSLLYNAHSPNEIGHY
jgi:hypothetical protein